MIPLVIILGKIQIERLNSAKGQRCCIYKCAKLWNDLPEDIKNMQSTFKFKTRLKKLYIQMS